MFRVCMCRVCMGRVCYVPSLLWAEFVMCRVDPTPSGRTVFFLTMEQLHRSMLRRIQSFPNSTNIRALYCLLGVRPLEQELDLRRLTLLTNVLYTDGTLGQDISMRQVSVKDPNSHSWFVSCNELLHKYSLPNIYTLLEQSLDLSHNLSNRSRPALISISRNLGCCSRG